MLQTHTPADVNTKKKIFCRVGCDGLMVRTIFLKGDPELSPKEFHCVIVHVVVCVCVVAVTGTETMSESESRVRVTA